MMNALTVPDVNELTDLAHTKHGVPSTTIVHNVADWLLQFSAFRLQHMFPDKPTGVGLAEWVKTLKKQERSILEGNAVADGHRISEILQYATLYLLADHYFGARWQEYAAEEDLSTFRDYAYWLLREGDDAPSYATAKRWVDVILLLEKLYLKTGRVYPILKLVGMTKTDLPADTPQEALRLKVRRWGRFAHSALQALAVLESEPRVPYDQLGRDEHRGKYDAAQRFRYLLELERDGAPAVELGRAAAGATQKAVEPLVLPPAVAADLTPRQKAELSRLAWIRLPGDFKPDVAEVRIKVELWPECPFCPGILMTPQPSASFVCHECGSILHPWQVETWKPFKFIQWDTGEKFTQWYDAGDIKIGDWKAEKLEVGGIEATVFTTWMDDSLSAQIKELMEAERDAEPPEGYDPTDEEESDLVFGPEDYDDNYEHAMEMAQENDDDLQGEVPQPRFIYPDSCPDCGCAVIPRFSSPEVLCIECAATIKGKEVKQ